MPRAAHRCCETNPAAKAHTYSANKHRAEMTVWSVEEMRDILRFAVDRRTYSLYRTALNTGLRRGELLAAFRWRHPSSTAAVRAACQASNRRSCLRPGRRRGEQWSSTREPCSCSQCRAPKWKFEGALWLAPWTAPRKEKPGPQGNRVVYANIITAPGPTSSWRFRVVRHRHQPAGRAYPPAGSAS